MSVPIDVSGGGGARGLRNAGVALTLACLMAVSATLRGADGRLNFVSCPMVRDTATVPCWLAEYEGETYFLTIQSDVSAPVTPPWLGHRVLVEGTISNEAPICGGVVLKPVRLSVLPERDASCNVMLPAESRYNLTFEPPRPPGPSSGRLAFAAPATPPAPVRAPAPDAPVREFVVQYDFDGMVGFSHPTVLSAVLSHARQVGARTIAIEGYRGAVRLSNGQTMREADSIGQRRAEQVAMLLRGAGLTMPTYTVTWADRSGAVTGIDDHLTRQVAITVRR